jgi:anti-sigma factor RsiW
MTMTLDNGTTAPIMPIEPDCLPRQRLKEYLAGWSEQDQALQIEQHLAMCAACEQLARQLEGEPDTLVQSLRRFPSRLTSHLLQTIRWPGRWSGRSG